MSDCTEIYQGEQCQYDDNEDYEGAIDLDNFEDVEDWEREGLYEAVCADLPHLCPEHDPREWVYV
jgi:hypothetical protein